jgi:hypothetical protein
MQAPKTQKSILLKHLTQIAVFLKGVTAQPNI